MTISRMVDQMSVLIPAPRAYIEGLVQDCSISSAFAMEISFSIWLDCSFWILKISNVFVFMQVISYFLQLHLVFHVFYAALSTVLVVVPLVTKPQESVIGFLIIVLTGVPYYLLFIKKIMPLSFAQGTKRECDIPYIWWHSFVPY